MESTISTKNRGVGQNQFLVASAIDRHGEEAAPWFAMTMEWAGAAIPWELINPVPASGAPRSDSRASDGHEAREWTHGGRARRSHSAAVDTEEPLDRAIVDAGDAGGGAGGADGHRPVRGGLDPDVRLVREPPFARPRARDGDAVAAEATRGALRWLPVEGPIASPRAVPSVEVHAVSSVPDDLRSSRAGVRGPAPERHRREGPAVGTGGGPMDGPTIRSSIGITCRIFAACCPQPRSP